MKTLALITLTGVISISAACGSSPANNSNGNTAPKTPATPANVAPAAAKPPANAANSTSAGNWNSNSPARKPANISAANKAAKANALAAD